ncbi:MAG: cobalamin biosynthesis protein [Dysosmobacter welbionis]
MDAPPGGADGKDHLQGGGHPPAEIPSHPGGEIAAGTILAALLPLGTLAFAAACASWLCIHPALCFAVQTVWQALAMQGLLREARRSKAVGTGESSCGQGCGGVHRGSGHRPPDGGGVIRAAVETVAENFCDSVAAPLLSMFLGGAP